MNVLIIEDEKPSARRLNRMLDDLGVTVDHMVHSVEEAIFTVPEETVSCFLTLLLNRDPSESPMRDGLS